MKIFYHDDMDGKCAANTVLWLDIRADEKPAVIAMQYGMDFPFEHRGAAGFECVYPPFLPML